MSEIDKIQAIKKWKDIIIKYLSVLYNGRWMPSHDIAHHARVWKNACIYSEYLDAENPITDIFFYEKLIIACFFHDVGLLENINELHGKSSRILCEKFLQLHADMIGFNTLEMLEAIENHDDKNYDGYAERLNVGLKDILIAADDFDALGAIGAYRYVEIYLLRAVESQLIPSRILDNALKRYKNFVRLNEQIPFDINMIESKFQTLNTFFLTATFNEKPVSLVNWININIVMPKKEPYAYLHDIYKKSISNSRIQTFIQSYIHETIESLK